MPEQPSTSLRRSRQKKDSGLFQLENVILSPHNAALTKEAMERMAVTAAKAVDDVLSGRKPQFVVAEGK